MTAFPLPEPMPKSPAKTEPAVPPRSYEEAIGELERLVTSLESGDLPLEAALAAHRRGIELTRYCSEVLARAEGEIKVLEGELLKALPMESNRPGSAYAQRSADEDE